MSDLSHATDEEMRRAVVRKVARRLIPLMGLMYFVNYLDRTNIGFAKLTMSEDLGLTEAMFGLASGLFFIGYLLFEVPSNLALHKFGARIWMARILVTWGAVASAMAFVPTPGWLYGLRVLLGIAEAGFFPGMILYLTYWLPRADRVRMTGYFLLAIPISSVVGAPLSTTLMQVMDGVMGFAGWRWMFFLQGLPAIVLAGFAIAFLTDRPKDAKWLSEHERTWLQNRLDTEARDTASTHHWPLKSSLTNPRIIGLGLIYFGTTYGLYALSFFLPTIVRGFSQMFGRSYSLIETGLIVAVPYAIAAVVMVWWAHHSDHTKERVWHVAGPLLLAAVSVPVALMLQSPFLVMVAVTLTAIGIFCALPVFWYLPTNFLTGASAAGGIALINTLGNASGFAAPYATGLIKDATGGFGVAMWVVGGFLAMAAILALVLGAAPKPKAPAQPDDVTARMETP
ncbi:MFS transporter [Mobilicoccus caccae]|uniref:MFS transporter n=1 Tax=Mobilicoccus caccae TaxID=1859295 RepID=A0ABQ6IZE4_9MICO|nr:MFS transporter [Mobilicoccus caccae]GMA42089.1 MFS transporter [Mobilicoccus caccae]